MYIKGMSLIRLHPEPKVWSSESSRNVTQQRENMMRHKSGRSFSKKTTSTAKLAKVMSISAARTLMTYVLEHLNCICACYRLTVSSVLSPGLIHWLKHDAFTEQSLAGRTLSLLRENEISQVVSLWFCLCGDGNSTSNSHMTAWTIWAGHFALRGQCEHILFQLALTKH